MVLSRDVPGAYVATGGDLSPLIATYGGQVAMGGDLSPLSATYGGQVAVGGDPPAPERRLALDY
ncbi:MAG TPA: hypothetical protein VHC43_14660 [Mycobacteriales bacterium]|nr:hypothetical protein [Mycobacteriales bacterium]